MRGALTYQLIEMQWGFALRPSDRDEHSYSFAGLATSGDTYPTFEAGCAQLVEGAIAAMVKRGLEEAGGPAALRSNPPAEPSPPPPTKT